MTKRKVEETKSGRNKKMKKGMENQKLIIEKLFVEKPNKRNIANREIEEIKKLKTEKLKNQKKC